MNRNIPVRQCSGCLEDRTRSGNPANRELVRPDHRHIAQNNCGVGDRSTVGQGARAADSGCVPCGANSTHLAVHFVATVLLEMHLAGICARMVGLELKVALTSAMVYFVAPTLIFVCREHGKRRPRTSATRRERRTCHLAQTAVAVDVETRHYAVAVRRVK